MRAPRTYVPRKMRPPVPDWARRVRAPHAPQETVLPVLLTPHDVAVETGYIKGHHRPTAGTVDLPWLWVAGVPRLVPGAATAYYGPSGEEKNAQAAAQETRIWLSGLAGLPAWGMELNEPVLKALTGRGPRRAAYAPPTMTPSGSNSGMPTRPAKERVSARALAAGLGAGAGPDARSETYPTLILSGPLKSFLDDLRANRAALKDYISPEQERAFVHVEDRLARALGEASAMDGRLTVDEVAAIERITASGVRKRAARGEYKGATRHHGIWLIPATAVSEPQEPR